MSVEKIIRQQGREKLKKNGFAKALFGLAMLAVFFLIVDSVSYSESIFLELLNKKFEFIISVVCRSVTSVCALLLSPAILGYLKMLHSENDEYEMSDVVYYFLDFKRYAKAIVFIFSYILRIALVALLFFLPALSLVIVSNYFTETTLTPYIIILFVLASLGLLIYSTKYFISAKLFFDDENKSCSYYFNTSKNIMRYHRKDIVKLTLSFSLWFLLCLTVLPLIYVVPYYLQSMCISSKWLYELSKDGQIT